MSIDRDNAKPPWALFLEECTCSSCGKTFPVPALARSCERRHEGLIA